ncbi:hypothetical protein [Actinoplanes sp. HUAS TT8]|uniref:hypothetical protein n=1 Tax=Actinoplanes sp. HUAS TT8 TaxID=3447453 RepID=UPI003F51BB7E
MRSTSRVVTGAAGLIFGLLLVPVPAQASVHEVNVTGQRSSGNYRAGNNVIRTFAGTYSGDFTPEDCQSAALQISAKFETSNKKVNLGGSDPVSVPLESGRRMLVVGVEDQTANTWSYDCVNIATTGRETFRYDTDGNGPFTSSSWVTDRYTFNGQHVYAIEFGDNDHGAVGFRILTEP